MHEGPQNITFPCLSMCHNRLRIAQLSSLAKVHCQFFLLAARDLSMARVCTTDRGGCNRTYSAPCPADWYAFNGGTSCAAPSEYTGPCKPVHVSRQRHDLGDLGPCPLQVLSGLLDMPTAEKMALEGKCDVHWPCSGPLLVTSIWPCVLPRLATSSFVEGEIYASVLQVTRQSMNPRRR